MAGNAIFGILLFGCGVLGVVLGRFSLAPKGLYIALLVAAGLAAFMPLYRASQAQRFLLLIPAVFVCTLLTLWNTAYLPLGFGAVGAVIWASNKQHQ